MASDPLSDKPAGWRSMLRDPRVIACLLGAGVLRALLGWQLWNEDPLARMLLSDPQYYADWARALAAGETFRPGEAHWLPPLYPWLLAAGLKLGLSLPGGVLVIQLCVGLFNTWLVMTLTERVTQKRTASLAAGALWTLYAPVIYFESRLLAVNAALPLVLLLLHAWLQLEAQWKAGRQASGLALVSGLLAGLACLARPNLMLGFCVGLVGLWWTCRRAPNPRAKQASWRGMGAAVVGLCLALAPNIISNYSRSGEWIAMTSNGGINFWFGNNEAAHGTFHAPAPEWGSIARQREVSMAMAAEAAGEPVTELEASSYWLARGFTWILSNPKDALRLYGLKLADTLSSTEFGIQYVLPVGRSFAPLLWIPCLPFGLLLALGVLGMGRVTQGRTTLLLWIGAGIGASLLYFTYSRFRLPLLVAWMPFAGSGLCSLIEAVRAKRWPRASLPAAILLAQSFVPFEGAYPVQQRANALVDSAIAAHQLGAPERSRKIFKDALELVPGNPRALHELAQLDWLEGREAQAIQNLKRALALPGEYPRSILSLAELELSAAEQSLRKPEQGLARLRKWIEAHSASNPLFNDFCASLAYYLLAYPNFARTKSEATDLIQAVLRREPLHASALRVRNLMTLKSE